MKKNQFCNALKVLKIIRIILSIIFLSYTLSLCIIGHCASEQDYFPMFQNHNGLFNETIANFIETTYDTANNYVFCRTYGTLSGNRPAFTITLFSKSGNVRIYAEKQTNLYKFNLYKVGNGNVYQYYFYYNNGTCTQYSWTQSSWNADFSNLVSSNYSSTVDYLSNFTLLTNNTETALPVLMYDDGTTIPDGDVAREDMEKPQINDYIPDWTNTPTFDNSSVENALKSVYNGVVWLGSNIKGTITGTGEYIADTVRWTVQKVINTIRDVFTAIESKVNDVKNAVLTVVDKIQATIDYISQPYDSTKVNTAFNNMTIKSDHNNLTTLVNNAFSVFDSTAEPNTFQIPIHLERIPILHVQTVQYIDLGWLYDCRGIIRAFMWCVTTFGLLYTIIDSLPNYLSGNDE